MSEARKTDQGKKPGGVKGWLAGGLRRLFNSAAKDSVGQINARIAKLEKHVEGQGKRLDKMEAKLGAQADKMAESLSKKVSGTGTKLADRMDRTAQDQTGRLYDQLREDVMMSRELPAVREEYRPWRRGEKIRVGILFQLPSAWPSLESLWRALAADERFDARIYLYDGRDCRDYPLMAGSARFLEERGVPFIPVERYTFLHTDLHIMLYQTPWDKEAHRPVWLHSDILAQLGCRIAYVPWELNCSASASAAVQFPDVGLKKYPWRVFTFSDRMWFDHAAQSPRGGRNVTPAGHPVFDAAGRREDYPLEQAVRERAAGRKIVLLQMRTPKKEGNPSIPEADVHEYISFLRQAPEYGGFFFLVRLQPRMLQYCGKHGMEQEAAQLRELLDGTENVLAYDAPDYRPALYAADCVIGDRSALLLEAAALGEPVLYMTNPFYKEKLFPAVEPVFNSFYPGSYAYDIRMFLDFVAAKGSDYKKEERQNAVRECLPPLDGMNGKRIADAMAAAIGEEAAADA